MTPGRIRQVLGRAKRRKDKRLERARALAFLERERTSFLDIIPTNDEHPAVTEAVATGPEGPLDVRSCIQAPAEDAVAWDQIKRARFEVLDEVLQPLRLEGTFCSSQSGARCASLDAAE